jgi:hypothetical protein
MLPIHKEIVRQEGSASSILTCGDGSGDRDTVGDASDAGTSCAAHGSMGQALAFTCRLRAAFFCVDVSSEPSFAAASRSDSSTKWA